MTDRSRRWFLAGTGTAFLSLAAGCVDEASDPNQHPRDDGGDSDGDDVTDGTDPGDEQTVVEEDPRVDEPPYEIERPPEPESPEEEDQWDDEYLGEHMPTEPSLEFDVLDGVALTESTLRRAADEEFPQEHDDPAYALRLVESEAALEAAIDLDGTASDPRETLEAVDFAEFVVVVVESGWGSSSIGHRWARVEHEAASAAIHLHGYYTDPLLGTTDYTTRHSVLIVERPDDLALARVSLTVSEDRRVHVNSTEGVVSLDD